MAQIEMEVEQMVGVVNPVEEEKKSVRKRGNRVKVAVDDAAQDGVVTYFNKYTMIAGVRCGKAGYQIPVKKMYHVGETVVLHVKDGAVTIE